MNALKVSYEGLEGTRRFEVEIPESWICEGMGLFLRFHSPSGWVLELFPTVRVLQLQNGERRDLFDDGMSALNVDGLWWRELEFIPRRGDAGRKVKTKQERSQVKSLEA